MSKSSTIDKLLAQALKAFAEGGYSGASLRQIVASAGLPLATVHNHFASKEALYLAVIESVIVRINRERLDLLESRRREGPLTLDGILGAIVDPVARRWTAAGDENRFVVLLIRQLGGSPAHLLPRIQVQYLDDTARAFASAIADTVPGCGMERAVHTYAFVVSSVYHALAQRDRLARIAGTDRSDPAHLARLVEDLKRFAAHGLAGDAARA